MSIPNLEQSHENTPRDKLLVKDTETLVFNAALRERIKDPKIRLCDVFTESQSGMRETPNKCQLCSCSLNDPDMFVLLSDDLSPLIWYNSTHSFYRLAA